MKKIFIPIYVSLLLITTILQAQKPDSIIEKDSLTNTEHSSQNITNKNVNGKIVTYSLGILFCAAGFFLMRNFLIRRRSNSIDNPLLNKETIEDPNSQISKTHSKGINLDINVYEAKLEEAKKYFDAPRFLQTGINDAKHKRISIFLEPGQYYSLEVRIGYKDENFFSSENEFDTETVFDESEKDSEAIQIKFKSNLDDSAQLEKINLPRQGNSDSAYFPFHTTTKEDFFQGEIYAYHRNRLIQHAQLTVPIHKESSDASKDQVFMKTIFCTRKNLADISSRTAFTASIEYESGENKSATLHGITAQEPVDLYFENGLKEHLMDMKTAIENALIDIKKHPANLLAKANQELLLFLAIKGNLIHTNFITGAIAPDGPIQIITNYQDYVPLEFVYTLTPPLENATLCKHAVEALKEGKCKGCFDHNEDPSPHVCPFGYWSFSRIVERHSYQKRKNESKADYILVSEPHSRRSPLQVLQNAIYGSSQRVETTETKGIRQEIASGIKKNTLHFFEANDWKDWTKVSKENSIDSLVLVVHIEKDPKFKVNKIEIGKDFVLQNYFRSQVIANNDMVTPPFIIVIGCESTNLASSGFDVSSHLMNAGAAIVISNFTKIRGRQAKDIVIKLFDFLKENGDKEIILGEIMLKLRQNLLAEGLIAGLSLVVQGDADWNIKS